MEQINNLLEEALEKKTQGPVNWQEKLLKFYKATQKKMCKISAIVLTIYLLLFYTPIVWLIANPLKISQPPEKADCIVVFAGGVGESGKAGQGYEERVQQAVQLYKNGYAQNMIFSSGYLYVFKEPLVMKSLAISLGIPEEAIILEDRAKNTYENVKFTKEIITDRGWDKILLISSEYHMRRVSLVAKKIAPEIETIYTPVTKSRFYRHGIGPNGKSVWKQTNLRQIRGLMHEYLGIVYYFMRGYI